MKVELELKNGRRKAFPEKIAKILVKRGLGQLYQTREMRPQAPSQIVASPEAGTSDLDDLRAQLDARGIAYHHRAGAATLRKLLED